MNRRMGGCSAILGFAGMAWAQGPVVSPMAAGTARVQMQPMVPEVRYQQNLVVPGRDAVIRPPVCRVIPPNDQTLRKMHPFVVPPGGSSVPLNGTPYLYEVPRNTWIPREYDTLGFYLIPLKEQPTVPMAGSAQTR